MENHAHTPQTLSRGLRCLPPEALLVLQARVLRHREGEGPAQITQQGVDEAQGRDPQLLWSRSLPTWFSALLTVTL